MKSPTSKRLYYGPWKVRRNEPVSKIIIRQGPPGDPMVYIESYRELERLIGPGVPYAEARKEERHEIPLKHIMEKLKLKDADYNLIELMKGGLEVILKLASSYQFYLRREEEKRNRPEYLMRQRKRLERERKYEREYKRSQARKRKQERLQKAKDRKQKLDREKEQKLEKKNKLAFEREQKRAAEAAVKKAKAEQRAKEKEEKAEAKRRTAMLSNRVQRHIEL